MNNKMITMFLLLVIVLVAVPFVTAYDVSNLNSGTSAYYKEDGNWSDATGVYDATNHGSTLNSSGLINSAYTFDGVNDYVDTTVDLNNTFSVSFWFNLKTIATGSAATSSDTFLTTVASTDRDGFNFLRYYNNNKLLMNIYKGDSAVDYIYSTKDDFVANTWYFVVLTYDAGDVKIYIDGSLDNSKTVTDFVSNDYDAQISGYYTDDSTHNPMNGSIDEVAFFDYVINSSDVEFLYANSTPSHYQQYPFSSPSPLANVNDSTEDVVATEQLANLTLTSTSYRSVMKDFFNTTVNNTAVFASYSWVVSNDGAIDSSVKCRLRLDGQSLGSVIERSVDAGQTGNLYTTTYLSNLSNGTHKIKLVCKRTGAYTQFTVSNARGVVHVMRNNESNTTINAKGFNSSFSVNNAYYEAAHNFSFDFQNVTVGVNQSAVLVVDGDAQVDYSSTGNVSYYFKVNDGTDWNYTGENGDLSSSASSSYAARYDGLQKVILVGDLFTHRVYEYNSSGDYNGVSHYLSQANRISGVAVDEDDGLYFVADYDHDDVYVYNDDWSYNKTFDISAYSDFALDIEYYDGLLYVLDHDYNSVLTFNATTGSYAGGNYSVSEDGFARAIQRYDNGWFMVGSNNDRVYVYNDSWGYTGVNHYVGAQSPTSVGLAWDRDDRRFIVDSYSDDKLYFYYEGVSYSPVVNRYGEAGSSGVVGGGFSFPVNDPSFNRSVNFSLFVKGDVGVDEKIVVRQLLLHDDEYNTESLNSTIITNSSSFSVLKSFNISNHHNDGLLVVKAGVPFHTINNAADCYFKLRVGSDEGVTITRSVSAPGQDGVAILQEVFNMSNEEKNVSLLGRCDGDEGLITGGSLNAYTASIRASQPVYFTVTASDEWDNKSISPFNVTDDYGNIFHSVNGTAIVVSDNETVNLTITAADYFNAAYDDHNTSTNLNASLWQSIISFNATQIYTGNYLTGLNYTVTDGNITKTISENDTVGLRAGFYNVTAHKAGYYPATRNFTVTILDNKTVTISGVSDTIINLTAREFYHNNTINNFEIYNPYTGNMSTSNGYIEVPAVRNMTFNFNATTSGYTSIKDEAITPNTSLYNYTLTFYSFNSIVIYIRNGTASNSTLLTQAVTIDVVGNLSSFTTNTSSGFKILDLLQPSSYELRFSSDGFNTISYYTLVKNDSTQTITVYMTSNDTHTQQLIYVNDLSSQAVSGAIVFLQEQVINSSSLWVTVQQAQTDFSGRAVMYVERSTSTYYRFAVKYDDEFRPISPSGSLYTTKTLFLPGVTENIYIVINTEGSLDDFITDRLGIATSLTNTSNDTVVFEWADPNNAIVGGKMVVLGRYLLTNTTFEEVYSAQLNSTSGSLSYTFPIVNNTVYRVEGLIVWSSHEEVYETGEYEFNISVLVEKNSGLLYAAVLLLVVALLTFKMGALISASLGVASLFVSRMLGFINWPTSIISSFIVVVIITFIKIRGGGR